MEVPNFRYCIDFYQLVPILITNAESGEWGQPMYVMKSEGREIVEEADSGFNSTTKALCPNFTVVE